MTALDRPLPGAAVAGPIVDGPTGTPHGARCWFCRTPIGEPGQRCQWCGVQISVPAGAGNASIAIGASPSLALGAATYQLPDRLSARTTLSPGQRLGLGLLALAAVAGAVVAPVPSAVAGIAIVTALYLAALLYRVLIFSRSLRRPRGIAVSEEEARAIADDDLPVYSVLVPAYGEPSVMARLIASLAALDYPARKLDIMLLLEADDLETIEAARACHPPSHIQIVIVPHSMPKTKPKACLVGLAAARGEFLTIYDAEDRPDPLQLRRAVVAFSRLDPSVACLQARLSYHNAEQNLLTRWFTAEYALWFSELLPGLVDDEAPIPLGGTSNHLRRQVLASVGGWDPWNVTEDADLGIRLHRAGYRTRLLDSVTLEEANSDFVNWVKQRSRWYKGYLQTWLVHMRDPRLLFRELGLRGFAGFSLFVLGTPLLAIVNPIFWVLTLAWFVLHPGVIEALFPAWLYYLSLLLFVLGNFVFLYTSLISAHRENGSALTFAALAAPLYWAMMSIAAIKAVVQLIVAPLFWEKTAHGLDQLHPARGGHGATGATDAPGERFSTRRVALSLAQVSPFLRVFTVSFLGYLVAAAILILGFHSIVGDAWSRVGNADYMLFSRDPHLAAIGFVWGPLPSLLALPLLLFWRIWPDLVAVGFAGSIVSAACMAAAVWQVWASMTDWGLGGRTRTAITALFALHPMIIYYAANGMSEAIFLLTLIVAARYLARWLRDGDRAGLVVTGLALALGYLTRYEAIPAALGASALVGVAGVLKATGTPRRRVLAGLADATVLVVPAVAAFAGFAFASLLIVGNPFEQFTSVYGIASQIAVVSGDVHVQTGQGTVAGYFYIARQVIGLSPAVLVLVPVGLLAGGRRPNAAALAVLGTLGMVVAWSVVGFLTGRTLGWLRYSIAVIPLDCLLAGALLATRAGRLPAILPALPLRARFAAGPARRAGRLARAIRGAMPGRPSWAANPRRWATGLFVALLVLTVPVGTLTMLDERNNPQEGGEGFLLRPIVHVGPTFGTISPLGQYEAGREVATYIDSLALRDGQVLIDVSSGFPIVLQSSRPRQFVITSDRDFQAALQSPQAFGVRYLLVPEDVGYASLDALNCAYPGIYEDPASVGTLVRTFTAGGNSWRLIDVGAAPAG